MKLGSRETQGRVMGALVRRLGGHVTLTAEELHEIRLFNQTANAYDDRITLSVHLPAIFKDELPAGFEGINIVTGTPGGALPEPGGLPAASNQERGPS
jgi:hypothetical protein